MNVALYARVSSEKQAENDLSISAQLKALRNYAHKNGWTIYQKEFVDEAESARSANRPAFQEMISLAKKKVKPFDIILVWKFSRFSRNRDDAIIYKSLLRKHGVSVVSMNEQVDDSPAGKLLEGIIEVIDEFYSLNLAEDTIRGLRENATRGFQNGYVPVGYKAKKVMDGNNERTKLEPDEIFAPIIKRIFDMCLKGSGIKEVAKTLNSEGLKTNKGKLWSASTISYILKNEAYAGTLVYGKKCKNKGHSNSNNIIRIKDNHPALISQQTFDKIQKLMEKRRPTVTHPKELTSDYLLSGLIYCGNCNSKMIGSSAKSGKHFYYACCNYIKKGKAVCNTKLINREHIEKIIIERLKTHVLTEENLMELFNIVLDEINSNKKNYEGQLNVLDKQIETLKGKLDKLYNTLETGKLDIDDLAPRIKELRGQINSFELKRNEVIEEIKNPQNLPFNLTTLKNYVKDLSDLLRKGSIVEQKSFLRSFIKRIVVNHPEIKIDYNIPIINKKGRTSENEVLPVVKTGSPNWTADRTFTFTVYLPKITKSIKEKVPKLYRNPIVIAKEYNDFINTGFAKSEADLARKLNISRVRVNQFMSLLKLDNEVIKNIETIGDPMSTQIISERKLRPLIKMAGDKQKGFVREIISHSQG